MTRVLVTGATGFVGRFVCSALAAKGCEVLAASRGRQPVDGAARVVAIVPESSSEKMQQVSEGVDAVIHLAAAVHDMGGRTTVAEYERVNRDFPLALARAALAAKVSRFVHVSTVKVNGDSTVLPQVFSETSPAAPSGPYAISKWQAEQGLRELGATAGLQLCIVRPPLVYGPGVRANFLSLMRWVRRGVPLPFGALRNARSLVYVENLADLLVNLALGPLPSQPCLTYLVSDGQDLSTPALVRGIARALAVAPRLVDVPEPVLRVTLSALGRRALAERLLGSLVVDSSLVRRDLNWLPPFSVEEGLARTAKWFEGTQ